MSAMAILRNSGDISEIYSPPRVTTMASKMEFQAGDAMILLKGWNFDVEADRERANWK